MKRERAETNYREMLLCPLCDHLTANREAMINHLVDEHSDEEALDQLAWRL